MSEQQQAKDANALDNSHPNHDNHLCHLVSHRMMKRAAQLSKGATHICYICGRAAADRQNLCDPIAIE